MKIDEFKALSLAMYVASRGGRVEPKKCEEFLTLIETRAVQVVIDKGLVVDGLDYTLRSEEGDE